MKKDLELYRKHLNLHHQIIQQLNQIIQLLKIMAKSSTIANTGKTTNTTIISSQTPPKTSSEIITEIWSLFLRLQHPKKDDTKQTTTTPMAITISKE